MMQLIAWVIAAQALAIGLAVIVWPSRPFRTRNRDRIMYGVVAMIVLACVLNGWAVLA